MQFKIKSQLQQQAKEHLLESAALKRRMVDRCLDDTILAGKLIADSLQVGGKLLLCGNGGSAADCQHLASEFVNCLNKDFQRPGLAAIALTTDTSFLTAYANDCNFEGIFSRQVETLGKSEDVLLGISTSGNSANVIQAMKAAKEIGISTIALTGSGGVLAEIADIAIAVPSTNTQHIQEGHLAIEHILCRLVEQHLFETA
ncbi:MAG: SIS domain-containing protein [Oscillatoria sp. SIO1A7]|nr:SIS domain-containing protein [Oscillatoria sp. SIO1A7]